MRYLFIIALSCISCCGFAQEQPSYEPNSKAALADKEDMNANWKFGIRVGASMDKVYGGEFKNPLFKLGQLGAATLTWQKRDRFRYQQQLGFSIKGARFGTTPPDEYNKIVFNYADYAHLACFSLYKKELWLNAGAQFSYLIRSVLYKEEIASNYDLYPKALIENPRLQRYDIYGVGGLTWYPGRVGLQLLAKYGFVDLNSGGRMNYPNADYPTIKPALNTGKPVRNLSFEFALLF